MWKSLKKNSNTSKIVGCTQLNDDLDKHGKVFTIVKIAYLLIAFVSFPYVKLIFLKNKPPFKVFLKKKKKHSLKEFNEIHALNKPLSCFYNIKTFFISRFVIVLQTLSGFNLVRF